MKSAVILLLAVSLTVCVAQLSNAGGAGAAAKAGGLGGSGLSRGNKPTIVFKTPREGERIPRSKGVSIFWVIDNHRDGLVMKFFFRSQEIALPAPKREMMMFEHPDPPPGFYTVRVELYDENQNMRLLQVKARRFMVY